MRNNSLYRLLILSYGISTFAEGILMPIYAIFVEKIGGDILDASGAIAIFLIVSGTTTILLHRFQWSQRHRMLMMSSGWLIWVLGIASYFLVSSTTTLFITQVFIALGNAVANPAFDAELDDQTNESYGWGIFEGLQDLFGGIAAIFGGIIASTLGFKVLIGCMVGMATISFLMILYYLQQKRLNHQIVNGMS